MLCLLTVLIPYALPDRIAGSVLRRWHMAAAPAAVLLFPHLGPIEYDKISAVHAAFYAGSCICLGIGAVVRAGADFKSRLAGLMLWSAAVIAAFLYACPHFFSGMEGNLDPYLKKIWLSKISEMQSPLAGDDGICFAIFGTISLLFVVGCFLNPDCRKPGVRNSMGMIMATNAVCYTIFAGIAYRMLPYAVLFTLPFTIKFIMESNFTQSLHRLCRVMLAFFFSTFLMILCTLFRPEQDKKPRSDSYTAKELFGAIDDLSKDPVVIMAGSDDGPLILYYTKHSAVAANYHRQAPGIIASHRVMEARYDAETVKSILKKTGSSLILVRKKADKCNSESLAGMIANGNPPDRVSILKLPERFADVIIAKIDGTEIR
jgi:hypothetical protein